MINVQTILKIVDNSGARFGQCIRILNKASRNTAKVGDIIVLSIKRVTPHKKIKKGTIQRAVIVRTSKTLFRKDGSNIKFEKNCAVILNKMLLPVGTRVFGPVCKELRDKKFVKILSLSSLAI